VNCPTCGQPPAKRQPITRPGAVTMTASGLVLDGWGFDAVEPADVAMCGWTAAELAAIATDLGTFSRR
jgi:hypothetical protein